MPNGARPVTLSQRLRSVGNFLLTSTWVGTLLVGGVLVTGLAGAGAYYGATELGWWRRPVVVDPSPEPIAPPEPIKIAIRGPSPPMLISGVSTVFTLDLAGPVGTPRWIVVPATKASVRSTDGRSAEVIAQEQGHFSVIVGVSGDGRQFAMDQLEIEAVAQAILPPTSDPAPPSDVPPPAPQPTPPRTVADVIMAALAQVDSPERAREAKVVAGCINTVVGQIRGGFVAPNVDVANLVEDAVQQSLREKAEPWEPMIATISIVIDTFRNQGQVTTASTTVPILTEISGVLLRAQ